MFQNLASSALYKTVNNNKGSITTVNHPFPWTHFESVCTVPMLICILLPSDATFCPQAAIGSLTSFVAVLFISIAFAFIPASFAVFLVKVFLHQYPPLPPFSPAAPPLPVVAHQCFVLFPYGFHANALRNARSMPSISSSSAACPFQLTGSLPSCGMH